MNILNKTEQLFEKELIDCGYKYKVCTKPNSTIELDKAFLTHQYKVTNWKYTPDFIIYYGNLVIYIETKGGNPRYINNKRSTYREFKKYCGKKGDNYLFYIVKYSTVQKKWYLQSQSISKRQTKKPSKSLTFFETLDNYLINI